MRYIKLNQYILIKGIYGIYRKCDYLPEPECLLTSRAFFGINLFRAKKEIEKIIVKIFIVGVDKMFKL